MKRNKLISTTMALALALTAVIGFAGTSSAQGHRGYGYYDDMSPEQ